MAVHDENVPTLFTWTHGSSSSFYTFASAAAAQKRERERGFVTLSPPRDGWMDGFDAYDFEYLYQRLLLLLLLCATWLGRVYTSSLFLWMLIVDILIGLHKGTVGRDCCEESENKSLSKRTGPSNWPLTKYIMMMYFLLVNFISTKVQSGFSCFFFF